jgi:6-phospho 3-hexuloisomerase
MRFKSALDEIVEHLDREKRDFDEEKANLLVDSLFSARRVFVYGAGRSGHVGRMFTQRLMHLGFKSYFLGETLTPALSSEDVLVVISGSGQTTSTVAIAQAAQRVGAKTVVLTAHPESSMAKELTLVIRIRGKTKLTEYESYAPFTTLFDVTCLIYLDSVAAEIMGRLNLTDEDIKDKHATVE